MNLSSLIRDFTGRNVVVLGDLVADVFVYGEISRISREAPVMILSHRDHADRPRRGRERGP